MRTLDLVLLIIACVLFALAALNVGVERINLVAAGLLAFALVPLVNLINAG